MGTRRGRRGAFVAFGAAAFGVVAVGVIAIEVAAMTAVWVAGGRVGIAVAIGVAGAAVIAVAIAGGNVAVGLAVGRPTEHPAEPIVLVSIVTAPFQASARPDTLAPVVKLTLLSARKVTIVVCIDHQLPGVAESKQRAADQSDEDERREHESQRVSGGHAPSTLRSARMAS